MPCANQANAVYSQEYVIEEVSIRDERPILQTSIKVKDGCLAVPDDPGLGVEVDEAAALRAWRQGEGHVPAGRVPGHLQRVGHAATDGTGAVQAGHTKSLILG